MKLSKSDYNCLNYFSSKIRHYIIDEIIEAQSGHPGGSLSAADITSVLYGKEMKYDPSNPKRPDRDRLIFSKGHGVPAQYAALATTGYFEKEKLKTLRNYGSPLQGHPEKSTPGIDANTGSLGMGLSAGLGMNLGKCLEKRDYHTFVLIGDGETNEGQVWEALDHGAVLELKDTTPIIDRNQYQIDGHINEVSAGDLVEKISSFGWETIKIDGHDINQIYNALEYSRNTPHPTAIVADTIKGKGVSFMENNPYWHGRPPKGEKAEIAKKEIGEEIEKWGNLVDENEWNEFIEKAKNKLPKKIPYKKFSKYNIPKKESYEKGKLYSMRTVSGDYIYEMAKKNKDICTMVCDLKDSVKLTKCCNTGRHSEIGIRESHMFSFASGLSEEYTVIPSTFDVFIPKGYDQIRMMSKSKDNVKIYTTHGGVNVGKDGFSHQSRVTPLLMYDLPNVNTWEPIKPSDISQIWDIEMDRNGMAYIRTPRHRSKETGEKYSVNNYEGVYKLKEEEKPDLVFAGIGYLATHCFDASKELEKIGIKSKVLGINNYKLAKKNKKWTEEIPPDVPVMSYHDATSVLAENIIRGSIPSKNKNEMYFWGVDEFGESGDIKDLWKKYGFDKESMVKSARKITGK